MPGVPKGSAGHGLAGDGSVDEDRVEALLRSAALPHSAVGVFIEVPPAGP